MTVTWHRLRAGMIIMLLAVVFLVPGCRTDDEGVKVESLEGKVEKIVLNRDGTGEITVAYFSEKHNQDVTGTGMVTKETEIMINGVVATLGDIREGERVRGEVRIEKIGGKKVKTALKINIDRPKPIGGEG